MYGQRLHNKHPPPTAFLNAQTEGKDGNSAIQRRYDDSNGQHLHIARLGRNNAAQSSFQFPQSAHLKMAISRRGPPIPQPTSRTLSPCLKPSFSARKCSWRRMLSRRDSLRTLHREIPDADKDLRNLLMCSLNWSISARH